MENRDKEIVTEGKQRQRNSNPRENRDIELVNLEKIESKK